MSRPRRSKTAPPSTRRSPCPIAGTLDLLGDRWTLLVVRDLFAGKKRYGELANSMEKIPTNLLAERLKRLEEAGVIQSEAYQDNPPRHEYSLTPVGKALRPLVQEIVNWGRSFLPGTMVRSEVTGNPADSPFLPVKIKLPAKSEK